MAKRKPPMKATPFVKRTPKQEAAVRRSAGDAANKEKMPGRSMSPVNSLQAAGQDKYGKTPKPTKHKAVHKRGTVKRKK